MKTTSHIPLETAKCASHYKMLKLYDRWHITELTATFVINITNKYLVGRVTHRD